MRGCPRLVAHLTGTWRASARPWPSPRLVPLRVSALPDSPLVRIGSSCPMTQTPSLRTCGRMPRTATTAESWSSAGSPRATSAPGSARRCTCSTRARCAPAPGVLARPSTRPPPSTARRRRCTTRARPSCPPRSCGGWSPRGWPSTSRPGEKLAVALAGGADPARIGFHGRRTSRSPRSPAQSRSASARSSSTANRGRAGRR